jgi:hypothetical protein
VSKLAQDRNVTKIRRSIALSLLAVPGWMVAPEAMAASGSGCTGGPLVGLIFDVITYALLALAVWQLMKANRYVRLVRKAPAPSFFAERYRYVPTSKRMSRHMRIFYCLILALIAVTVMAMVLGC